MRENINTYIKNKQDKILSVFFTAGYPKLNDTMTILHSLQESGCDLVELGIPFSDPLADGVVIQESSKIALENGMSIKTLFEQTKNMRQSIYIPVVLMGYLNPILQYGFEKFLKDASLRGFDAVIIPDLPLSEYQSHFAQYFDKYNIKPIFLITPYSTKEKIREIDKLNTPFIYLVTRNQLTGNNISTTEATETYFQKLSDMRLKTPLIAGFGISDASSFQNIASKCNGAIIGSAFIKHITRNPEISISVKSFIKSILNPA